MATKKSDIKIIEDIITNYSKKIRKIELAKTRQEVNELEQSIRDEIIAAYNFPAIMEKVLRDKTQVSKARVTKNNTNWISDLPDKKPEPETETPISDENADSLLDELPTNDIDTADATEIIGDILDVEINEPETETETETETSGVDNNVEDTGNTVTK